ncbi:hypothetical protein ACFLXE_02905 [Chloroflexota bacterium]
MENTDYNKSLFEIYKNHWPSLRRALEGMGTVTLKLSYPLMMHVFPGYEKANPRLLVVGQETYGWGFNGKADYLGSSIWDDSIEKLDEHGSVEQLVRELTGLYEGFKMAENYYSVPFWRAIHELHRRLNPNCPKHGFLWTNLIKVSQSKRRPSPKIERIVCDSFPVLLLEIKAICPDVVVFFTGPLYDSRLEKTFDGLSMDQVNRYAKRHFSRLIHKGLPENSFRTYHPGYFQRSGKLDDLHRIIDRIVKLSHI